MKDYTKQLEKEKEKLSRLETKLNEFREQSAKKIEELKKQSADKIAEMTAEIKQQKEAYDKVRELDKQEKLMEIARLLSTKGADVNMLFNAVQSGDLYGVQEIFEKQDGMKPEQEIPEGNDESDEAENLTFLEE